MSTTSEVDIANLALGHLGEERITALTEDDDCNEAYPLCRDATLEEIDWTFAIRRFSSGSPSATAPAYGYTNRFLIDNDVLRVIEVNGNLYEWEREGQYILTDQGSVEYRAVTRILDVRQFSPGFIQALSFRLAATIAISKTNSKSVAESMWQIYGALKVAAQGNDGRQGKIKRLRRTKTLSSRAGYYGNVAGPCV